jgi:flagellar assembly protein FliH
MSTTEHPSDLIRARDLEGVDVWALPSFDPAQRAGPEPEVIEEEVEEVPLEKSSR